MAKREDADRWLSEIDLASLLVMFRDNGVAEILYKVLPRNANSKNQVWLARDLSQLGKLPTGEITAHVSKSGKRGKHDAVFRSALSFFWLDRSGQPRIAPGAQLIFYPQYPEVRLSGFLLGCANPPSSLWTKDARGEEPDRILLLGLGDGRKIIALTLPPESPAAREIVATGPHEAYGALNVLPMREQRPVAGYLQLMHALCAIHRRAWVPSTRLDPHGLLVPCNASNCNGNTLESLLGIRSNGFSLPDFHGWEVKARLVSDIAHPGSSRVTLFTPEPDGGLYVAAGVTEFMSRYGYPDRRDPDHRRNFGGIYKTNAPAHERTGLRLIVDGFDSATKRYVPTGAVRLLDGIDVVAASWSFAKLLDHWKLKHAQAAFVPSQCSQTPTRQYQYGRKILLGEGAEFGRLLQALHERKVYYDPGIKLEGIASANPKAKKRSQFRVSSDDLPILYESSRIVDACEEANGSRLA